MMYPLFWRWHFLIGVLAAPLLLLSSITGALYAFAPQLEPRLAPALSTVAPCADCRRLPPSALLELARQTLPEATPRRLVQGADPLRSVEVILDHVDGSVVVLIDPWRGWVLGQRARDSGFFGTVLKLHRELFAGKAGRWLIELATSWLVVTLLLGLTLWWPRRDRLDGAWRPRWSSTGRRFWRDLHAVAGFYVLPLALILLLTGLFFSQTTGRSWTLLQTAAGQIPAVLLKAPRSAPASPGTPWALDATVSAFLNSETDAALRIDFPSDAQGALALSRHVEAPWGKLRRSWYDLHQGTLLAELRWQDLKPGAKLVLLMYPLHAGLIGGWPTQLLVLLVALTLAGLTLSGVWMWWQRRGPGQLALPPSPRGVRLRPAFWLVLLPLALLLPMFGGSLLLLAVLSALHRLAQRVQRAPRGGADAAEQREEMS